MMKTKRSQYRIVLLGALLAAVSLLSCSGFEGQLMYNEAQRAHNQKNFQKAIMIYEKLLKDDPKNKIHPDNEIIRYDLGVAYLDSGNRRKALEQIKYLKSLKRNDLVGQLEKLAQMSDSY